MAGGRADDLSTTPRPQLPDQLNRVRAAATSDEGDSESGSQRVPPTSLLPQIAEIVPEVLRRLVAFLGILRQTSPHGPGQLARQSRVDLERRTRLIPHDRR